MILEMWFRTVLGASVRWAAIVVLLCPAAIIARTHAHDLLAQEQVVSSACLTATRVR